MDHNYDDQSLLSHVQKPTITFPVFVSVVGIISIAFAVMLYHFILLRYCHHHRSSHPAAAARHRSAEAVPVSWLGLDDKALEAIPVLPFCERALEFFHIEQSECVVCLGRLERGERVRWLPGCAHAFHVTCIDNWLHARASCPTCRAPVVVPPPLLRQFVARGGLTRARSGGVLRHGDAKDVTSPGLKRSLSLDRSCIVIDMKDGEGDLGQGFINCSSVFASKGADRDHAVLPY